jgi:hypothetical protein
MVLLAPGGVLGIGERVIDALKRRRGA